MRQGIGRRGGTPRMHAEPMHIGIDAHHGTIFQNIRLSPMKVIHFFEYYASNNRRIFIDSNISICFI